MEYENQKTRFWLAIGKVCLMLTSCTALSHSSRHSIERVRSPSSPSHRRNEVSTGSYSSVMVTLRYRDGGETGAEISPISVDSSNQTVMSIPRLSKHQLPAQKVAMLPQLFITLFTLPIIRLRSPPTALSRPRDEGSNQEQLVMDEYLEFVERRYSRMHPKPQHSIDFQSVAWSVPQKLFLFNPTMSVALDGGQISEELSAQQQHNSHKDIEEDPLNVLGLSDLASDKLRQRLHLSTTAARGRIPSYVSLSFFTHLQLFSSAFRRLAYIFTYSMQVLAAVIGRIPWELVSTGRLRNKSAVGIFMMILFMSNIFSSR